MVTASNLYMNQALTLLYSIQAGFDVQPPLDKQLWQKRFLNEFQVDVYHSDNQMLGCSIPVMTWIEPLAASEETN